MKNKYIQQLEEAYQRLIKTLDQISDSQRIYDGWTKKELMAHVTGWYEEGVSGMEKILKGEKPDSLRMSVNGYNKRSLEKRKSMNLAELKEEMVNLHQKWLGRLKLLSEEQITGFYVTTLGKKPINVEWMIKECISHDNNHARELEEMSKN